MKMSKRSTRRARGAERAAERRARVERIAALESALEKKRSTVAALNVVLENERARRLSQLGLSSRDALHTVIASKISPDELARRAASLLAEQLVHKLAGNELRQLFQHPGLTASGARSISDFVRRGYVEPVFSRPIFDAFDGVNFGVDLGIGDRTALSLYLPSKHVSIHL